MPPPAGPADGPALPYQDTARSWVVALACAWSLFWTMIITRISSVMFVAMVSAMAASREATSWPFNLLGVATNVSGVIAGLLLRKFTVRRVAMAGVMATAVGVLLCAAFYDLTGIAICYGVLGGLGQGFVYLSNEYAINNYFKRYRASASGINWAGSSLATFVFPSVIVYLNDQYGLRGTFIIVGGLTLNAAAGCIFLTKPEERASKPEPSGNVECVNGDKDIKVQSEWYNSCTHHSANSACEGKQHKGDYIEHAMSATVTSAQTEAQTLPGNNLAKCVSLSSRAGQDYTGEAGGKRCTTQESMDTRNGEAKGVNPSRKTAPISVVRRELSFLKRPIIYVITLSSVVYASVSTLYGMTLADHAMGQGLPEWPAALLVSCNGVGDIIAQLSSGQISDRKFCHRRDVMAISFLLMASSMVILIYAKSMALLVVVALLYSLASGSILMIIAVITVDYLGLENLPLASSFQSLACAIVAFPRPLLIGYYRDRRESYIGLYVLLAVVCFAVGLVWTVECLLQWRASKRLREEPGPPQEDTAIVGIYRLRRHS
ncbi:monocarboxylate transporter 12-like [Haemaphysalis longicornis]